MLVVLLEKSLDYKNRFFIKVFKIHLYIILFAIANTYSIE